MVLQSAAGVSYIADAFSRETDNGIHVPGAVPDDERRDWPETGRAGGETW
jgi:hypothetical protein